MNNAFCSSEISFVIKEDVKEKLLSYDFDCAALVLSESAASRWDFYDMIDKISSERDLIWIKDISSMPTQYDIISGIRDLSHRKPDVFIAIGGGSAIDLAKSLSVFMDAECKSVNDVTDALISRSYADKDLTKIIALPTTAGTGSELTQWGTVWDFEKKNKYSVDAPELKPIAAIICPEFTLSLPPRLTLSTGLDALSHSMEAFWSAHTNDLIQDISLTSASLIAENLSGAINRPGDIECRTALCRGSVLSALAFSQTRTAASHAISYPLTMNYGIEHGFAVAITLDEIMQINRCAIPRMHELESLFQKYGGFKKWMQDVTNGVVSLNLSSFGAEENDLEGISKSTGLSRMGNNPINLDHDDVYKILKRIF